MSIESLLKSLNRPTYHLVAPKEENYWITLQFEEVFPEEDQDIVESINKNCTWLDGQVCIHEGRLCLKVAGKFKNLEEYLNEIIKVEQALLPPLERHCYIIPVESVLMYANMGHRLYKEKHPE